MRKQNSGFTLIELVMVMVVLAILAIIAMPIYNNLTNPANTASEAGVVGGVRAGIATYIANDASHNPPGSLDAVAVGNCSAGCFGTVLMDPVKSANWSKTGANVYVGPSGAPYTYTPASGKFQ